MGKGLAKRTIMGLVLLALMTVAALNAYAFLAIFGWLIWLMTEEFFKMTVPGRRLAKEKFCIYTAELSFYVLVFCHLQFALPLKWSAIAIVPLILSYVFMLLDCRSDFDFNANLFFPIVYVMLPIVIALVFTFARGQFDGLMLLAIGLVTCLDDVGAYMVGMAFGQRPGSRKISPNLSPKKSLAGLLGGVAATFVAAFAAWLVFGPEELALVHWMVIALIVSVFGILGDLFESLIKRHASVKDAGRIMPGHGGALDRFDSMLFVFPLVILYLKLIAYF